MLLMVSEKKYEFTIWPIFMFTKYERKLDNRAKREKKGFVVKQKKINNSDVKAKHPLRIYNGRLLKTYVFDL